MVDRDLEPPNTSLSFSSIQINSRDIDMLTYVHERDDKEASCVL